MHNIILRKIDPITDCFVDQRVFEIHDDVRICELLDLEEFDENQSYRIDATEYDAIVKEYKLEIQSEALAGEIVNIGNNQNYNLKSHTGRELILMLDNKKPFSAFVDVHPAEEGLGVIPECFFEPFVEAGKITKRVHIEQKFDDRSQSLRRVLYALPGEEWRFDAYLSLWSLCGKYGWNTGFEKIEGFLLGYEPELDHFFKAQIEQAA
jgi:hypothetical protein